MGKQFSIEDIGVIAENKENNIQVLMKKIRKAYRDKKTSKNIPKGADIPKLKRLQLRFIDNCRFLSSSLDSLVSNLGVNDLKCNICKNPCRMSHVDENYIVHAKCQQCYSGGNTKQLDKVALQWKFYNIYKFCDNDEFFRLMLRKVVYPYEHKVKFTHDKNKTMKFTKTHMAQEKIIFPQGNHRMISPRIWSYETKNK